MKSASWILLVISLICNEGNSLLREINIVELPIASLPGTKKLMEFYL
jgi:hypothetical protein